MKVMQLHSTHSTYYAHSAHSTYYDLEVLLLYSTVDEFVMTNLMNYGGKSLVSAEQAKLNLNSTPAEGAAAEDALDGKAAHALSNHNPLTIPLAPNLAQAQAQAQALTLTLTRLPMGCARGWSRRCQASSRWSSRAVWSTRLPSSSAMSRRAKPHHAYIPCMHMHMHIRCSYHATDQHITCI